MKKSLAVLILSLCAVSSLAAFADDQPIYKWTDGSGTVHYSDKPPKEAPADLQTLDLPAFPAQDPAKLAAAQAAQVADTTAVLKQLQAEDALQQQEAALAQQQAQLQAEITAADQADDVEPAPVDAIYVNSPFVPKVYRRNLYRPHPRMSTHQAPKGQAVMRRAATPIYRP